MAAAARAAPDSAHGGSKFRAAAVLRGLPAPILMPPVSTFGGRAYEWLLRT